MTSNKMEHRNDTNLLLKRSSTRPERHLISAYFFISVKVLGKQEVLTFKNAALGLVRLVRLGD